MNRQHTTDQSSVNTAAEVWQDAAGTKHRRAGSDARIVSLVPSITELVIDLGLADRLVGRTHFCVHPAETVADIPSVGGTKKASLTKLKALAPTHVILNIDENTRDMAEEIGRLGVELIVTHPMGPEDNRALYRMIGGIFGCRKRAEALCSQFDRSLTRVRRSAAESVPKRVLYFIWKDPWMTISRDTYIARMLNLVGWQTGCHDPAIRYPEVTITPALLAETDLILFSSEPFAFADADLDEFADTYKCPREKLALIDGEYCSWYGSRAIAGLDYLGDFAAFRAG